MKRALASSYRATGQNDKAAAIEKEVGVAAPAPALPSPAAASAGAMNAAIALYNEKKYDRGGGRVRANRGHGAVQSGCAVRPGQLATSD